MTAADAATSQKPDSNNASQGLLAGRVALVTGAAGGIGLAVAKALAAEGARLVLDDLGCARDGTGASPTRLAEAAAELSRNGAELMTSDADITDSTAVAALFERAAQEMGSVDILVNCAGIIRDRSLMAMRDEDWDAVVENHLRGAFVCTRAFANLARQQKRGGSIVNMTSVSGLLGNLGQANESSAKAGVYGLTRTSSIELQKYGITVNAVAAIARTRLTEDLPMFEKVSGSMEPEHVAPAVVYLVSELAEGLSGVVLSVAGGRIATIALAESEGRIKEANEGVWTPAEIAENYASIARR